MDDLTTLSWKYEQSCNTGVIPEEKCNNRPSLPCQVKRLQSICIKDLIFVLNPQRCVSSTLLSTQRLSTTRKYHKSCLPPPSFTLVSNHRTGSHGPQTRSPNEPHDFFIFFVTSTHLSSFFHIYLSAVTAFWQLVFYSRHRKLNYTLSLHSII